MDQKILKFLACPNSKNPLHLGDESLLNSVNEQIRAGKLSDISGNLIKKTANEVLYEPINEIIYLVYGNIPILIYENGVKWQ